MIKRVMVIGLDSAPLELLEPWMEAGELPNLSRLATEGSMGVLNSTFPPLSPAAWSSFATGMNPGKHGVYDHGYRQPGSYRIVPTNALRRGGKTVWQLISEQGGRVGVINVPETYPPEPLNGFMITGMTTPSEESEWCYPATLKEDLETAMGGYQIYGARSKENLDLSLAGMHETIPMRMKAAAHLWKNYAPEFMILVFMETDVVQHKTWKYMDSSHPQYDADGAQKYGRAILDVYKQIDDHLPLLLDQVDEETAVIIMSDHGAGPIDKWLNLNNWLVRKGFLRLKTAPSSRLRYLLSRLGLTPNNAYKLIARLQLGVTDRVADQTKKKSSIRQANPLMRLFLSFADVDWSRTRAYTLGGNLTGLWINLEGREPEGGVAPGTEYERLRDKLINELQDLCDPDDGQPIATAIYRREEVYDGPYVERAPDILFETRDEQYVGFGIQEFVTNAIAEPSPVFSGCHRRAGMVILHGQPFRQGVSLSQQDIMDVTPTILHLLGYSVPEDMDGQVMTEAMNPAFLDDFPIRFSSATWQPSKDDESRFSEGDEERVTERLRSLGYL
ncbi:MAG: hypothetical protein GY796_26950 [Chloroflexi bacterium]|nr:hypothetical protein [Chloroflexota bacterium]